MHVLLLFCARHAVAIWLTVVGVSAFVVDVITGHL